MSAARRTGSLLIMTLWMVAVLTVLSVSIARHLSLEIRLTKNRLALEQARILARSGVYLAMQRLSLDQQESDGLSYDWLGDDWAYIPPTHPDDDPTRWVVPFPADGGTTEVRFAGHLTVQISDEERKLPLNTATPAILLALTGNAEMAQAIVDAFDEPDPAEDRPDDSPPYFAKNGPFVRHEELLDLPDMTNEVYDVLRAATSPHLLETEPMNINTVTPEVLRAMGVTESTIDAVTLFRDGPDGPTQHALDGVFTQAGVTILETLTNAIGVDLAGTDDGTLLSSNAFNVSSNVFTVTAEGRIARPPVRVRLEAVIRRTACGEGRPAPCIIAWKEG